VVIIAKNNKRFVCIAPVTSTFKAVHIKPEIIKILNSVLKISQKIRRKNVWKKHNGKILTMTLKAVIKCFLKRKLGKEDLNHCRTGFRIFITLNNKK